MKTRVTTRNSPVYPWEVEVYNPHKSEWSAIGMYSTFWYSNFVAWRLSRGNLSVKMNEKDTKDEFCDRLAGSHEESDDAVPPGNRHFGSLKI